MNLPYEIPTKIKKDTTAKLRIVKTFVKVADDFTPTVRITAKKENKILKNIKYNFSVQPVISKVTPKDVQSAYGERCGMLIGVTAVKTLEILWLLKVSILELRALATLAVPI